MKIYNYEDLEVYKVAFSLQQRIFESSKAFPKEESYSLTDKLNLFLSFCFISLFNIIGYE